MYRAERLPSAWVDVSERWLAVEVASPSTRVYDRAYKLDGYLAMGVRELWLIDPAEFTVTATLPFHRDPEMETRYSSRSASAGCIWPTRLAGR